MSNEKDIFWAYAYSEAQISLHTDTVWPDEIVDMQKDLNLHFSHG